MTTKANGQTGPITPEGKRRSSMNALKHGLNAASPQAMAELAEQYGIDYINIREQMRDHYRPADPIEEQLIDRIARCLWRLRMSAAMENRLIERQPAITKPGTSYERVMRYERLVDIHLHRAIATLARKREAEAISIPQNEMASRWK